MVRRLAVACCCLASLAAWSAEPEIDSIELTGVTAFTQAEIQEVLDIAPGDEADKAKIDRSVEDLQELYRLHGYEEVTVSSRLDRRRSAAGAPEWVLRFAVREGEPTRIAAVRFTPGNVRSEVFRKYWRGLEAELESKAALAVGDRFDQAKLSNAKRTVQDLLASEEFIGAKVTEVRVTGARRAGHWVDVDFRLDLGDRVVFGFRGNSVFSLSKLSGIVDEQRVLGFGKDYVSAIRGRIEDEYRAEGYADVRVTPYTSEVPEHQERRVTFDIQEGPRVTLDEVDFDGNSVFSNDALRTEFFKRAPTLIQHGYFVGKDVQKAVDLLVEWMKSRGYLSAKVVTITNIQAAKPKRAGQVASSERVVVYLYEGDQTRVQSVRFEGLHAFTAGALEEKLGLKEGQPLNLFAFNEGIEAVKAAYRAKGYLDMRIDNEGTDTVVQYSDENRLADVQLHLTEGYQFKVSSIVVEGLVSTQEIVVRHELSFAVGDILSDRSLADSQARLRRLGIFSSVTIQLHDDPERPDAKRVVIVVQEGTPGVFALGPGFRNDLGPRVFTQLAYTDVAGLNHTLSLSVAVNHRLEDFHFAEYQVQVAYLYPWFLDQDITFRPSITASGIEYVDFDATTFNVSAAWEKKLLRSPAVTAVFTYSLEHVVQFDALSSIDNQDLLIGSVIPSLRFDTRDNPLSPTTGWYGTLSFELAAPWLLSQANPYPIGYIRVQGRLDRIIPVGNSGISLYLSVRGGFERSDEPHDPGNPDPNSGAIPLIEQFALGGASSLRGYTEQELNAYGTLITGSLSYVNYRTQIDFPIAGALRIGPFLDAANLLVDNSSLAYFFEDSMQFGTGFGFHYVTPVGPVNLDLGIKLSPAAANTHPQPGEGDTNFYFSIGLI